MEQGIMKKEERNVLRINDVYKFTLESEQEYSKEQVDNMLKAWNDKKQKMQEWLDKYDDHLKLAVERVTQELENGKKKLEMDLEHIQEGIDLWGNPEEPKELEESSEVKSE